MTRTTSLLFLIGLIIAASLGLYRTSNRVQELDGQLRSLNASIDSERENMHVLKAEWVYLANPARVEAEAKKHLDLRPTVTKQIATLNSIAALLPSRAEAVAAINDVTVAAKPIASIRSTLKTTVAALAHRKPALPAATMASADSGYFTDHVSIQRTASAEALPDSIGTMLDRLNTGTR